MMSNDFDRLGWILQNCNTFATDTQPTQTKIKLAHVYAPSQLQNSYVPQKNNRPDESLTYTSLQENKSSSHIPCTCSIRNRERKKHLKTRKKVAFPDYVGVK